MRSRPYDTTMLWLAVVALAFVSNAVLQLRNIRIVAENEAMVSHTNQVRAEIFALGSSLKDAQRGARGFIITSNAGELEPYHRATIEYADHLELLRKLTADNHSQQARLDDLQPRIAALLNLLGSEVEQVQAGNRNAPRQSVRIGTANSEMDWLC